MGYELKSMRLITELHHTYIKATERVNEICKECENKGEEVRSSTPIMPCPNIKDKNTGESKTMWVIQLWVGKKIYKKVE